MNHCGLFLNFEEIDRRFMRVDIRWLMLVWVSGASSVAHYTHLNAQIFHAGSIGATGGAGYGFAGEVGALLSNPAGIATIQHSGVLLAHHYSHHQPDVSSQALLFALPLSVLHLGASYVQYTLPDAYYDRVLGTYLGRSFGPNLRIALGLQFKELKIPSHLEQHTFQLLMGMQYDVTSNFTLGLVLGPFPLSSYTDSLAYTGTTNERKKVTVGVGTQYRLGEQVLLRLDQRFFPFNTLTGIEYQLVPEAFTLRMGMATLGLQPTAGVGYSRSWWRIDLSGAFHQRLGWSPQLDLSVNW